MKLVLELEVVVDHHRADVGVVAVAVTAEVRIGKNRASNDYCARYEHAAAPDHQSTVRVPQSATV
jgi:hypothetical protein